MPDLLPGDVTQRPDTRRDKVELVSQILRLRH